MQLLVDPIILMPPEDLLAQEQVIDFLLHLDQWNETMRDNEHQFFLSDACLDALIDGNHFPSYQAFQKLCFRYNIYHIDPKTAFNACRRIFENAPRFEERAQISGLIEVYAEHVSITPNLPARHKEPTSTKLRETLGAVAYVKEIPCSTIQDLGFVSHPMGWQELATIDALVETNAGPVNVTSELPLVYSPEQLRRFLGLQNIWQDSSQAIEWAIEDLQRRGIVTRTAVVASYSVSDSFNLSIQLSGYHERASDLKRIFCEIALLLLGHIPPQSTRKNHELRGVDCNSVDAEGRTWEAWRLWITEGHAALRLHYWRHEGKFILSRIVPHEDMRIDAVPSQLYFTVRRALKDERR